jgi:serine/threonine-protein kinase RsbW
MSDNARGAVDVPTTVESIDTVQAEFESWWHRLGDGDGPTRYAFETAVVEIAGNIVEHTHRVEGTAGRRYRLELFADAKTVTAVFTDSGSPADIDLSTVTMAEADEESGRGLALALAALRSLDYRRVNGQNIWTLVCLR